MYLYSQASAVHLLMKFGILIAVKVTACLIRCIFGEFQSKADSEKIGSMSYRPIASNMPKNGREQFSYAYSIRTHTYILLWVFCATMKTVTSCRSWRHSVNNSQEMCVSSSFSLPLRPLALFSADSCSMPNSGLNYSLTLNCFRMRFDFDITTCRIVSAALSLISEAEEKRLIYNVEQNEIATQVKRTRLQTNRIRKTARDSVQWTSGHSFIRWACNTMERDLSKNGRIIQIGKG